MKRLRAFGIFSVVLLWLGLSVWCWVRPADDISPSERRKLAQFPLLNRDSWFSGSFTNEFESYANDQFPLRDGFRSIKAVFHRDLLLQKDSNGIYLEDGYAAQLQYPLQSDSITYASGRMNWIFQKYLADSDCKIFVSIVPDKHYFLAEQGGYPSMDYQQLNTQFTSNLSWAEYIDLYPALGIDDYYRTDTHWRQENLLPAADVLCDALGIPAASEQNYTVTAVELPFYGVYRGQSALPMQPETICTLRNPTLDGCRVFNYETGKYTTIYDEAKYTSRDLYDVYLSGATALLRIENPEATTDRELIVFRDSFGSSMIPLLVHGYKTVTVIDTRYISPAYLSNFLEFSDQDVLFIYSTILLNQSNAMK